jgi:hypothetical protein
MPSIRDRLEFENGQLVKVDGKRPEYMDGYALIRLVRDLATEIASPAGATIRSAQDEAMEPVPTTGQPPVGAGSPYPFIIDTEDRSGEAA